MKIKGLNFNYIYRFLLNFRRPLSPARGPSRKTKTFEEREQEVKDFMKLTPEQIKENEKKYWTRSAPADLYYHRDSTNPLVMHSTDRYVTNTVFPHIVSAHLCTVTFGLMHCDLWISESKKE